jgi:hypothetical protein
MASKFTPSEDAVVGVPGMMFCKFAIIPTLPSHCIGADSWNEQHRKQNKDVKTARTSTVSRVM